MFGLNDSFGRVMIDNLKVQPHLFHISGTCYNYYIIQERNISIPGVEPYPDEQSLPNRFLNAGFTAARALTLKEIRRAYIESSELER